MFQTKHFQEDDVTKMLAATTHIGSSNSEKTMEQYIYKKKNDGGNIINLKKTHEKLLLAARAIAAVENPLDVYVCASRPYTQRAVLKFARYSDKYFLVEVNQARVHFLSESWNDSNER